MWRLLRGKGSGQAASAVTLWDNTNRLARIVSRLEPYARIGMQVRARGVPTTDVMRTQFPFWLADAKEPPIVSLEFGTVCNFRCKYCETLIDDRPKRFMPEEVFSSVLRSFKEVGIGRVKVLGGEPTLHPKFPLYIRRLAQAVRHLAVVTNGAWRTPDIAAAMIEAPVDLIEISIDAGGREQFNASRVHGDYDRVLANLTRLAELRGQRRGRSLINVRLMVRPSNEHLIRQETLFYKKWADIVMPQRILKVDLMDYSDDVYVPLHFKTKGWPKCAIPFKSLEIKWDGEMPLCGPNARAKPGRRISLGNITDTTIAEAWNGPVMRQYRAAHRARTTSLMPACRGCVGI